MNQDIAPDNTLITEQALIDYTQSLITDTYVKRDASNITTEGITVTQDPNDQNNYI
jgi:predicted transcriptional regulator